MKPACPTNPFLSLQCRKLLQKINAGGRAVTLDHDKQAGTWWIGTQRMPAKPCEEAIRLCAIRTVQAGYPVTLYNVSDEGNRLLTLPTYIPAMEIARQQSREQIRASQKCQS